MIGKVLEIDNETINVILDDGVNQGNLVNQYLIINSANKLLVGEVINIKGKNINAKLIGEIIDNEFIFGVINRPNVDSKVYLMAKDKIPLIISVTQFDDSKDFYLGMNPVHDIPIGVNINKFFSQHYSILGSTGSGKSCGVARIFQNIFYKKVPPLDMHLCIFDAYGEYNKAFSGLSNLNPNLHFKAYSTNLENQDSLIRLPAWLLSVDDLALLLEADKPSQLLIIEKALSLVKLFKSNSEQVEAYKNDIIARAILDVLLSGRPASQIRDQVFSVLSVYKTNELNLDTLIYQPGYTRNLKQCLLIDKTGKITEMELLIAFFNQFVLEDTRRDTIDEYVTYNLMDLDDAFNFALVSEGVLKSDHVYDEYNTLRVRIHALANGDYHHYFEFDHYVDRDTYIKELLMPNGVNIQIVNFNINYVDDRFAKNLVKIYSKIFFDYEKELKDRGTFPIHLLLEEAHRYVQNDNDVNVLGYNIFDRITKEGRKYGLILGLISQRPSELSETCISQCANFIIFKTTHYRDTEYIRKIIPNITEDIVKQLKILQPGNCLAFGSAFKVPVLVRLDMPDPSPNSDSVDVSSEWFSRV